MSADSTTVVRRLWEEVWQKDEAAIKELISPSFIGHYTGFSEAHGVYGFKQLFTLLYTAFPDLVSSVEDVITGEDNKVTVRYTATGTHTGDLLGNAPTGKAMTTSGIAIYRVVGGKIVEAWGESNNLGMLQQVGIVPQLG